LQGTVYIAWDDNFPQGLWTPGLSFGIPTAPGTTTILDGGPGNLFFGEEIIGGFDWDGDGTEDLFVGDITGDGTPQANRQSSGFGIVFYDAAQLAGEVVDLDMPPLDLVMTRVLGTRPGALTADTAVAGDFDGDGRDDLGVASPHAAPLGRTSAGAFHILHGREGPWPAVIDLAGPLPAPEDARITEIFGALGTNQFDAGDTLGYSAAAGSIDGDARDDLICNEMTGNGLASGTVDVGNLIVISGDLIVPEPSARALTAAAFLVMAALRRAGVRRGPRSTRDRP
jgi:hypothetical protein